jgi:hypothetical protein
VTDPPCRWLPPTAGSFFCHQAKLIFKYSIELLVVVSFQKIVFAALTASRFPKKNPAHLSVGGVWKLS